MNKLYNNSKEIYFFLLLLLSFTIGLQIVLYKILIILLFFYWLFTSNFKNTFYSIINNNYAIGLIILYFFYAISFIWSQNGEVLNELILKSPLLILPLVVTSNHIVSKKKINLIILVFALSVASLNMYCLIDAYLSFIKTKKINDFFYYNLTINMHTSYQAMFTCFSIISLLYLYIIERFIPKRLAYSVLIFQIILLFLLSSRMQILIMIALIPVYIIVYYYRKKKIAVGIFYIVLFFIVTGLIMNTPSKLNLRYKQTISHINSLGEDNYHTDHRKFIWKNAIKLIKKNWLFGAGDAKKELVLSFESNILEPSSNELIKDSILKIKSNEKVERKNNLYKILYERDYNFHNQYLETFAKLGVFGFLLLLYLIIFPFFNLLKNRNYLAATFLFIVGSSLLTESMFERQAGVSFIAFFYTILVVSKFNLNKLF